MSPRAVIVLEYDLDDLTHAEWLHDRMDLIVRAHPPGIRPVSAHAAIDAAADQVLAVFKEQT